MHSHQPQPLLWQLSNLLHLTRLVICPLLRVSFSINTTSSHVLTEPSQQTGYPFITTATSFLSPPPLRETSDFHFIVQYGSTDESLTYEPCLTGPECNRRGKWPSPYADFISAKDEERERESTRRDLGTLTASTTGLEYRNFDKNGQFFTYHIGCANSASIRFRSFIRFTSSLPRRDRRWG